MNGIDWFFVAVFSIFALREPVGSFMEWRERHDDQVRWEDRVDSFMDSFDEDGV